MELEGVGGAPGRRVALRLVLKHVATDTVTPPARRGLSCPTPNIPHTDAFMALPTSSPLPELLSAVLQVLSSFLAQFVWTWFVTQI